MTGLAAGTGGSGANRQRRLKDRREACNSVADRWLPQPRVLLAALGAMVTLHLPVGAPEFYPSEQVTHVGMESTGNRRNSLS
jgi:hypothetical protein